MSRGRTFPFALLVDAVLEGLASLEDRSLGGFDLDFLAGAGIAGSAGRPGLHFERAKAEIPPCCVPCLKRLDLVLPD